MRSFLMLSALLVSACARSESAKDSPRDTAAVAVEGNPAGTRHDSVVPLPSPRDSSPLTPRLSSLTVLIVGTSLTAGLGLDPEDAYPALLQRKADSAGYTIRVVNAGLSGETSAGALRRIDWLLREPADVVMIETGANDGLRGLDTDSTRENLRAIMEKVRRAQPGATLFLMQMEAPPNLGSGYTSRFRAIFPSVAREYNATLVPFLLDRVAGIGDLNQADGIHPNRTGSRIVAENVWLSLETALRGLRAAARG
jgi:acyl-CoA thioesterase-1